MTRARSPAVEPEALPAKLENRADTRGASRHGGQTMADCTGKGSDPPLSLNALTLDEDLSFAAKLLSERRPRCPSCSMRLVAIRPRAESFECFRCGHVT